MSTTLTYSPADIVRYLLIDLGLGTDPLDGGTWPIYVSNEPDRPDNCITIYDTRGLIHGRMMPSGVQAKHYGVQIRIRCSNNESGWVKADAIWTALCEDVYHNRVDIEDEAYCLHNFALIGDILVVGHDSPATKRKVFTINPLLVLSIIPRENFLIDHNDIRLIDHLGNNLFGTFE